MSLLETWQKGRDKEKVLLVDDNFDMREYVARLLSPKYEVISVSNGAKASTLLLLCLSHS